MFSFEAAMGFTRKPISTSLVWFEKCLVLIRSLFGLVWFGLSRRHSLGKNDQFPPVCAQTLLRKCTNRPILRETQLFSFFIIHSLFSRVLSKQIILNGVCVSIMRLSIIDSLVCCTNWDYWKENGWCTHREIWQELDISSSCWNFCNWKSRYMRKLPWRIYSNWIFLSLNFWNGKANIRHCGNLSARPSDLLCPIKAFPLFWLKIEIRHVQRPLVL